MTGWIVAWNILVSTITPNCYTSNCFVTYKTDRELIWSTMASDFSIPHRQYQATEYTVSYSLFGKATIRKTSNKVLIQTWQSPESSLLASTTGSTSFDAYTISGSTKALTDYVYKMLKVRKNVNPKLYKIDTFLTFESKQTGLKKIE